MAAPLTLPYSKWLILISDMAPTPTFTAPCGLTSRGMNNTANMTETTVPDCDETKPATIERGVDSLSSELSGSGVVSMADLSTWREWFTSGETRDIRVVADETGANGGGYWEAPAFLTTFNISAERGQKASLEISIQFDGFPVWADAA